MKGSDAKEKGSTVTSQPGPDMEGEPRRPRSRALREEVGYCWPVFVTPRVARLLGPTAESGVLCEDSHQRLRRVLWLAGTALRDMPPEARQAEFEIMIDGRATHLAASFDGSDELAIRIDVVDRTEWGRGVDTSVDRERLSRR